MCCCDLAAAVLASEISALAGCVTYACKTPTIAGLVIQEQLAGANRLPSGSCSLELAEGRTLTQQSVIQGRVLRCRVEKNKIPETSLPYLFISFHELLQFYIFTDLVTKTRTIKI